MTRMNDIRSTFLSFFQKEDHKVLPSDSIIPSHDPSLLFTSAGMVPFKNYFTGQEKAPFPRMATSQKCLRAGGKHNDLENVGYTARHHTFFEMLGNFSFGDYFKERAIELAWTLITKEFQISRDRLLITVYAEDDEAATLWKKISGFSDHKIIRISTSDNFWSMGDTGPCGPCSEIFYDHGDHIAGGPPGSADADGDRFVEIWNLVFMQFDQGPDGRVLLPRPSIDTGMGLERISAVLQGVHDNFEIDLFKSLIQVSADITKTNINSPSHRVIVDHLRAMCFMIAEGILPSNEGRGYVLRRIMRRAMRHCHLLGAKDPTLYHLVSSLVHEMGEAYPELKRGQSLITQTIELEENRFLQTLEKGMKLLREETAKLSEGSPLPGEAAFKLYDTYGFPLDLTQDVLRAEKREVDTQGFEESMEKQRSKKTWVGSGATDLVKGSLPETLFIGYEHSRAEGTLQKIFKDGEEISCAQEGDHVMILLDQTPFYGESGGQSGDQGILEGPKGFARVKETKKTPTGAILHIAEVEKGSINLNEKVELCIDEKRRHKLKCNHSATHLLHHALREKFGPTVVQKGSLVEADRLRFDFSHASPLTVEDVASLEDHINSLIWENKPVRANAMSPSEAISQGAIALFGEKYGAEVRVISMGDSVELCGGTHVSYTGDIGLIKIVGESGVAAGVRRIEAITGAEAFSYLRAQEGRLKNISSLLKSPLGDLEKKISSLLEEKKVLEKKLKNSSSHALTEGNIEGIHLLGLFSEDLPPRDLKGSIDQLRVRSPHTSVYLALSTLDNKISLVVGISEDLKNTLSAATLVKSLSGFLGGTGGGREDIAQGGGIALDKVPQVFEELQECVKFSLKNKG